MKAGTIVHIGIRNVGDSTDKGEFFEGQLKEGFLWLAAALGSKSMATRFVIGIGRNRLGAEQGIQAANRSSKFDTSELGDALDALLAGESPDDVLSTISVPTGTAAESRSPLDTWQEPSQ